jgi:prepilin-type N-terminal cleavage/methylation domain-containing protein
MTSATTTPCRRALPQPDGKRRNEARSARGGMTLVELMVSMVILTILATLSLAGMSTARARAKAAKTTTTIRKISEIILPYYELYETRRPSIGNSDAISDLPNGRTYLTDAKQTAIRRLMTLELPERQSDVAEVSALWATSSSNTFSWQYVPDAPGRSGKATFPDRPPSARRYAALIASSLSSYPTSKISSADLLHLIITRGPVADPDIIAHFRDDEVRDTNGNGLLEFVDGWNNPIQFRRWPIGYWSPMQPIDGSPQSIDTLISNNGHRLVPLVFSAGPDGVADISANVAVGDVAYASNKYDPFKADPSSPTMLRLATPPPTSPIAGSVVLTGEIKSSGPSNTLLLTATRLSGNAAIPARAFHTIGSECDVESPDGGGADGILQSRDNITNHNMTR